MLNLAPYSRGVTETEQIDLLESLNPEQREVATTFGVPVVVLAGAGTGKTRAITHRIAYGARTGAMDPRRTLAVTFTVKAASELRERLARLGVPGVQARTFHSAALRQLRYFWPKAYGSELPELVESTSLIVSEAARLAQLEPTESVIREIQNEISWAKVSNVTAEDYPDLAQQAARSLTALSLEQMAVVMEQYEATKRRRMVIDFDDVLLCTVAMMHEHPEVAEQIRDQYRHFTVDEYQDLSPIQQALLELWLGGRDDVCAVGDTNQAIHSFAGADPVFLSRFSSRFPNAHVIRMRTNYRSTPQILKLSNSFLSSEQRLSPTVDDGPTVAIESSQTEEAELEDLAAWFQRLHADGVGWADMAVLFRVRSQATAVQEVFHRMGIPTTVVRSDQEEHRLDDETPEVRLSTMHASKGLEWQAVAVIGVSEGLVPLAYAETDHQIAEEKRLLYVAMTRARRFLRISWASGGASGRTVRPPSRFIKGLAQRSASSRVGTSGAGRRKRRVRSMPRCSVCQEALENGTQIKLGRHETCEVRYDAELLAELKQWRTVQAEKQSMPAFVVFTDATLQAIAERCPMTDNELRLISGIGYVKAERYGADILEIVKRHMTS